MTIVCDSGCPLDVPTVIHADSPAEAEHHRATHGRLEHGTDRPVVFVIIPIDAPADTTTVVTR